MQTRQQFGFSVVEMLVAIVVFALLVPTITGFLMSIGNMNDQAKDIAIVNSTVENKVESLRSAGFLSLTNGTTDFTNELPATVGNPRTATYTISSLSPNIKQIDFVITYTTARGENTATFSTQIGEIGVGQY